MATFKIEGNTYEELIESLDSIACVKCDGQCTYRDTDDCGISYNERTCELCEGIGLIEVKEKENAEHG